jgi:hypothetical protein
VVASRVANRRWRWRERFRVGESPLLTIDCENVFPPGAMVHVAASVAPTGYLNLELVDFSDVIRDDEDRRTWESHEAWLGGFGRHEVRSETFKVSLSVVAKARVPTRPHKERITIRVFMRPGERHEQVQLCEFVHQIRVV